MYSQSQSSIGAPARGGTDGRPGLVRAESRVNRPAAIAWIGAIMVMAVTLFLITYQAQNVEKEVAALNRKAIAEQEAIHVLRAEWSYLNRPERLSALAERHLGLQAIAPAQMIAAKQLDGLPKAKLAARGDERLQDLLKRVMDETAQ